MSKTFVPSVNSWELRSIVSRRRCGYRARDVREKIGKDEEFGIGDGKATGDDVVLVVGNETVPLFWIEVGVEIGFTKKEYGEEADLRVWYIESVFECEGPLGGS